MKGKEDRQAGPSVFGRILWHVRHPIRTLVEHLPFLEEVVFLRQQVRFLLNEVQHVETTLRYYLLHNPTPISPQDVSQTQASFDYQWEHLVYGKALPSDPEFMSELPRLICKLTQRPADWFPGKRVLDIGAGVGRFTHGFLSLGACVTATDCSNHALQRTSELCREYADSLTPLRKDLLQWDDPDTYDLVFAFGVVHHTGNTYLAIRNAAAKVKAGGRLFLMAYGIPQSLADFREVNTYEALRRELYGFSFERKAAILKERFGPELAHGYFDAVSPRINDLLSYEEIKDLLNLLGFHNVKRTLDSRNHHLIADKLPT